MQNSRTQPTLSHRSANPQPGSKRKIDPALLRLHAFLGKKRREVLPVGPRQTDGIGPIGQAEQAKEQGVFVREYEQRQEALCARVQRAFWMRERRLRPGAE